MIESTGTILVFFAYIVFAIKRLMTYNHVLQQEEYDNGRLFSWMMKNKVFDKKVSFGLLLLSAVWAGTYYYFNELLFFVDFIVFSCFVLATYNENDPRKNSKKKLVSTNRARRIYYPALLLLIILALPCFYFSFPAFWVFNVQIIPIMLILSNLVVGPIEEMIQLGYMNEAKTKMKGLNPKIIGITGSYGKTSVKHILGHILKTQAQTLITPGSVNTPMGITRIIREELNDSHKYFVVEMGAYGPGSIARLCKLTPPDMGIITAIGHAHYERFKSLEAVAKTKYELAEAVIKKGQCKVIAHERTLRFPYARRVKGEHSAFFTIVGEPPNVDKEKRADVSYLEPNDLQIVSVDQMPKGLQVKLNWKKTAYFLEVPLYGAHHGHNTALAFAAAMELGIDAGDIQTALQSLPQIPHRLEVKKQPDGTRLIDDAYNSNPVGFKTALDLMSMIVTEEGRKIVVTPGMVEMGSAHGQSHKLAGAQAGEIADIAVVVCPDRIPTFIEGFKSTGSGKQLVEVTTFDEAAEWLDKNRQKGDVILLENDLPDIYERIPKL